MHLLHLTTRGQGQIMPTKSLLQFSCCPPDGGPARQQIFGPDWPTSSPTAPLPSVGPSLPWPQPTQMRQGGPKLINRIQDLLKTRAPLLCPLGTEEINNQRGHSWGKGKRNQSQDRFFELPFPFPTPPSPHYGSWDIAPEQAPQSETHTAGTKACLLCPGRETGPGITCFQPLISPRPAPLRGQG